MGCYYAEGEVVSFGRIMKGRIGGADIAVQVAVYEVLVFGMRRVKGRLEGDRFFCWRILSCQVDIADAELSMSWCGCNFG